jgi:hypothetical protein
MNPPRLLAIPLVDTFILGLVVSRILRLLLQILVAPRVQGRLSLEIQIVRLGIRVRHGVRLLAVDIHYGCRNLAKFLVLALTHDCGSRERRWTSDGSSSRSEVVARKHIVSKVTRGLRLSWN